MTPDERLLGTIEVFCRIHSMFAEAWADEIRVADAGKGPSLFGALSEFGTLLGKHTDVLSDADLREIAAETDRAIMFPHPDVAEAIAVGFLEAVCAAAHRNACTQRYIDVLGPSALAWCEDDLPSKQ